MNPGEAFEIACYNYLIQTYGHKSVTFHRAGGMDSTVSDIAVIKNGRTKFYIEAKDSHAHSGQFVLLPDENTQSFVFSPKNKSQPNAITEIIINFMNSDFSKFNNAGTAGETLDIDPTLFSQWIIEHYRQRQVKYVISRYRDFVILPIEKFAEYFEIGANYRIKKSGSQKPAQKDIPAICDKIQRQYPNAQFAKDEKRLLVKIDTPLTKNTFPLGSYTYMLAEKAPGYYEIRRLSNTYNMNVLFTISIKKSQDFADLQAFEADL